MDEYKIINKERTLIYKKNKLYVAEKMGYVTLVTPRKDTNRCAELLVRIPTADLEGEQEHLFSVFYPSI